MNEQVEVELSPRQMAGLALRLFMLQTQYRQPINFTHAGLYQAGKTLARWYRRIEPCEDGPPDDLIEALCQDLNTPLAIARMHAYYKQNEGRKLYASLRLLGLLPREDQ